MGSLEIKKNRYGLRVFCSKCDKLYYHNTIHKCRHGEESQTYKSVVYTPGGGTRSRHHKSRTFDEALIEGIEYKKEVKSGSLDKHNMERGRLVPGAISVIEGANIFLRFKHGIDVPTHLKENLSKKYLDSIEYYLGQFIQIMKDNGYNVHTMPLEKLNEKHVGIWAEEIRTRYSKGSWDAPLRVLRLWVNFLIKRHGLRLYNPFHDVKLVHVTTDVAAITKEEFEGVLSMIDSGTSKEVLVGNSKIKDRYRPYLKDAFRLALQTGLRREEFLSLTWDNVVELSNGSHMIITDNLKVERMTGKKYKKKFIPVHDELRRLLKDLGWDSNVNGNSFILEPERKAKVITMMGCCTKAFTFYFKQAFPERKTKTLKVLRKTYLSYLGREVGEEIIHFSSHSGMKVLEDHYLDKTIVTKALQMNIFSPKNG